MPASSRTWLLVLSLGLLRASCGELCRDEGACPASPAEEEEEGVSALQLGSPAEAVGAEHRPKKEKLADFAKAWVKPALDSEGARMQHRLQLRDAPPLPNKGEDDALGLLILTYGYPTQPGDIDDKRSFCAVDANYQCTDGFSIVKAEVHGLEFVRAQNAEWDAGLEEGFTNAVRVLLKHSKVRAITANCGFMTNYEANVSNIIQKLHEEEGLERKPMLMGSLSLAPLLTRQKGSAEQGHVPGWGLLKKHERAVVVTANSATLGQNFYKIMNQQGMKDMSIKRALKQSGKDMSPEDVLKIRRFLVKNFGLDPDDKAGQRDALMSSLITAAELNGMSGFAADTLKNAGSFFRTYGAQDVTGFGAPVAGGYEHNVSQATVHMNQWVMDTLFRIEYFQESQGSVKGAGIILECTELPAYANGIRMVSRLPVWDITTMGQCLMAAAPSYDPELPIRQNPDFKDCMLSWTNPYRFEKRFGRQTDNSITGYVDGKIPARAKEDFDWGLLGKPQGERCTPDIGCVP